MNRRHKNGTQKNGTQKNVKSNDGHSIYLFIGMHGNFATNQWNPNLNANIDDMYLVADIFPDKIERIEKISFGEFSCPNFSSPLNIDCLVDSMIESIDTQQDKIKNSGLNKFTFNSFVENAYKKCFITEELIKGPLKNTDELTKEDFNQFIKRVNNIGDYLSHYSYYSKNKQQNPIMERQYSFSRLIDPDMGLFLLYASGGPLKQFEYKTIQLKPSERRIRLRNHRDFNSENGTNSHQIMLSGLINFLSDKGYTKIFIVDNSCQTAGKLPQHKNFKIFKGKLKNQKLSI